MRGAAAVVPQDDAAASTEPMDSMDQFDSENELLRTPGFLEGWKCSIGSQLLPSFIEISLLTSCIVEVGLHYFHFLIGMN